MSTPFTKLVSNLPATTPFVGPESLERQQGKQFLARIGANESAFGISPKALSAMRDALNESSWYADPENFDLRQALADKHGVHMDEICVDAGIDSLLGLTVRMLLEPGQTVVTSFGAYPTLNYHVAGFGAALHTVPYNGFHEDPAALVQAAAQHSAKLVYLSNPDNPMGTWHSAETLSDMIDAIPEHCVFALDEAYIEFADTPIAPPIDTSKANIIRYRTFSKAYGMAGQRIGYAIAHKDIITGFNKIRNHFGINRIAQQGALACLDDADFLPMIRKSVSLARERVMKFVEKQGFAAEPSSTNFVAVDVGSADAAKQVLAELNERQVFMRMPGVEPLNRCIRVGLGTDHEFDIFCQAFTEIISQDNSLTRQTLKD